MITFNRKCVTSIAKRISPYSKIFQHFTFVSRKPDLKISKKITTQNLYKNELCFLQKGYSFSS